VAVVVLDVDPERLFQVSSPGDQQPVQALGPHCSTVYAEFRVFEYRWSVGDGRTLVTQGPGRPGLASEVRTAWPRGAAVRWT
jgi:hypothetical protein